MLYVIALSVYCGLFMDWHHTLVEERKNFKLLFSAGIAVQDIVNFSNTIFFRQHK